MVNEKLILETLANHTGGLADLQMALAGLTSLVESRLPDLTPEQKETLRKGIDAQKKDAEKMRLGADNLRRAIQGL